MRKTVLAKAPQTSWCSCTTFQVGSLSKAQCETQSGQMTVNVLFLFFPNRLHLISPNPLHRQSAFPLNISEDLLCPQVGPSHPSLQMQEKASPPPTHVPPLEQGPEAHELFVAVEKHGALETHENQSSNQITECYKLQPKMS